MGLRRKVSEGLEKDLHEHVATITKISMTSTGVRRWLSGRAETKPQNMKRLILYENLSK